ncbi:hypothetical protein [Streptomyces sp. NPDC046197]|uniref:hypothetical protein n=1 Tax=Streptomyces sp. NPDC046197 TaxID=3154337 RepID=UPI0033C0E886
MSEELSLPHKTSSGGAAAESAGGAAQDDAKIVISRVSVAEAPGAQDIGPWQRKSLRRSRLAIWLIFGVAFGLVPLAFDYVWGSAHDVHPTVNGILAHGELLLLATVVCAETLGKHLLVMMRHGTRRPTLKIIVFGLLFLLTALYAMSYAHLRYQGEEPVVGQETHIAHVSLAFFGVAVVTALVARFLAEGEE